jgi:hypothetical protein
LVTLTLWAPVDVPSFTLTAAVSWVADTTTTFVTTVPGIVREAGASNPDPEIVTSWSFAALTSELGLMSDTTGEGSTRKHPAHVTAFELPLLTFTFWGPVAAVAGTLIVAVISVLDTTTTLLTFVPEILSEIGATKPKPETVTGRFLAPCPSADGLTAATTTDPFGLSVTENVLPEVVDNPLREACSNPSPLGGTTFSENDAAGSSAP